jgi:hypothetical protein
MVYKSRNPFVPAMILRRANTHFRDEKKQAAKDACCEYDTCPFCNDTGMVNPQGEQCLECNAFDEIYPFGNENTDKDGHPV